MATSRRRTAKKDLGQNLNDLDRRLKSVERRPRSSIDSWSVTSDMLAPGLITLDKLSPELLTLLQQTYSSGDSTGDTTEEQGFGITDALVSSATFSTNAANGKNSLFFSATRPDEGTYQVDDIWYDTSLDTDGRPKYTPYQWDGDSWEPALFGDAAFRFLNAGKIATGVLDAAAIIRVGQYPTSEGFSRLEISGGSGDIEFSSELAAAITSSATTLTIADASGLPSPAVTYNLKIDAGTPDEEVVLVTARTGTTLAVVRGVSGSSAAHDEGAEVDFSSTFYAGITVLSNPDGETYGLDSASQSSLPALFRLDATQGSFFLGDTEEFIKFNTPDSIDRLSISGQLKVGTGDEALLIGPDVGPTEAEDGIRLGPYNYWYRPNSVTGSTSLIFKAGSSGTEGLTVTKGGAVNFEGTTNPTGGVIKGKLSIRAIAGAVDRIEIGQNVLSNRDGLRIDANNHWTVSNTGGSTAFSVGSSTKQLTYDTVSGLLKLTGGDITLTGGGTFKTADSNTRVEMTSDGIFGYKGTATNPIFYIRASDGTASFEGETNPTGGTVKGKLTIQGTTYAFGKDVMSVRDGLFLNSNNYWTLSQTGATAEFRVGGSSKYVEWNGSSLNISGTLVGANGTFSGGITANSFQTAVGANNNFIRMSNVDGRAKSDLLEFVYVTPSLSKIARSSSSPVVPARMYLTVGASPTTDQTLNIEGYDPGGASGFPPEINLATTGPATSTISMFASSYNISTGGSGSILIVGNTNIQGTFTVNGTAVDGNSGGYSNATDGTTTNKITYGGTAPTSGRTAGDIHIEF